MFSTANDGNNKIWISDDVFNEKEIENFLSFYCSTKKPMSSIWYSREQYEQRFSKLNCFFKNASLSFNFEGVELWTQYNTKTPRHQDKDEHKINTNEGLSFPLYSTIIFLKVENDQEGFLMFDSGISIRPKVNRVVLFTPGTFHEVSNFKNERVTLLVNFWNYKIKGAL